MHTQNLLDNKHERARYYFHRRGWAKSWRWEACWAKNPAELKAMLYLGGEDERQFQLALSVLGVSVYLTFPKLLPERWAIGWYSRGDVKNPRWHEDSMGRAWGFWFHEKQLSLKWGACVAGSGRDTSKWGHRWTVYMPWDWSGSIRHDVMRPDGTWVPAGKEYSEPYSDGRAVFRAPFTYTLKDGTIQNRTATFYAEEREWRWRLFRGYRIGPKIVRRSIWISFDGEVGERTGSWKGGTTGCGYDMNPGETPEQCLRRMERERVFD